MGAAALPLGVAAGVCVYVAVLGLVHRGSAVAAVGSSPLLAWILLGGIAFCGFCGFCAALIVIGRVLSAAVRLVRTAPERVAGLVLTAELAAGPVDAHPDTYAARMDALPPLYSDRTTTTPGGTL